MVAVLRPRSLKAAESHCATEVLPLVPVMPVIHSATDGWSYQAAASAGARA